MSSLRSTRIMLSTCKPNGCPRVCAKDNCGAWTAPCTCCAPQIPVRSSQVTLVHCTPLVPTSANLRTPDCSHCSTRLHTPCAALQAPPCTGSPGLARCHSRNPVRVETHGSALKRAPSHAPSCIAANAQRCNLCASQPQHVQHPAKPPIQQVPPSACAQYSTAHDKTASAHLRCQQLQANEANGHGRLHSAIGKAPIAAPLSHSPLTTHTTLLP